MIRFDAAPTPSCDRTPLPVVPVIRITSEVPALVWLRNVLHGSSIYHRSIYGRLRNATFRHRELLDIWHHYCVEEAWPQEQFFEAYPGLYYARVVVLFPL